MCEGQKKGLLAVHTVGTEKGLGLWESLANPL